MADNAEEKQLIQRIARVLDESRVSHAIQTRKLKELSSLRSSSSLRFFPAFSKAITPLFEFQRRTASAERIVRFVAVFSAHRDEKNVADCDGFLEEFLRFLLVAAVASNKTARFRSCQIISEIIMRLPDDAEVSNELWDDVVECMKIRVGDKVPAVRTLAVRALARFANDAENSDIVDVFLQALALEQTAEVRKTIVLSLPPSSETSAAIIGCTLDVSESVRRAAFCVLANKFPIQSLSIKLRTIILQRGLAERAASVKKECLKLLKDEWLVKFCNGDPIILLKFLDVETYEVVGEVAMEALLKAGVVNVQDSQIIQQFLAKWHTNEGQCNPGVQLMEAEVALYWRTICRHVQSEAQAKGLDAAATMGTEAVVYAAEASDNNEILEKILPAAVCDYVELVKAHLSAGPNYRFTSRQLLLLGAMLDFSDATNRKVASAFVQELLHRPLDVEVEDDGNKIVVGDGINLGGDRDWATAVSDLTKKVHASAGEFEEVVVGVVEELARPCRERTADFMQWMQCLAVTNLLLENVKSFRWLQGKAIEPAELLHSLLLPGARHAHSEVQRAATRCLGLLGLLERNPTKELIKQLRLSFVKGPSSIRIMASKALIDLVMWHGPQEVDRAMGPDVLSHGRNDKGSFISINVRDMDEDLSIELLDLLYAGLDTDNWGDSTETDGHETVQAILGEGFAKILLLSENYPSISDSFHPLLLAKLICLYFSNESKNLQRLKQCLSVFFEHYPRLSVNHKKCVSKAFVPVMRSMWPGIYGNSGGSPVLVSNMRKRAIQASRFMLEMIQAPLYSEDAEIMDENGSMKSHQVSDNCKLPLVNYECGEEGLAIRIATEVANFPVKKTAAERSYISALSKIAVLIHFRSSEQQAIKLMSRLLSLMAESVLAEKELVKELKQMAKRLKALETHPDEELSKDHANLILERLELDHNLDIDGFATMPPTPAPRSTKLVRSKRQLSCEVSSSDEEENSPTSVVPPTPSLASARSQRASKTAALTKMTAQRAVQVRDDDDDDEGESSDVTSDEDSNASDHSAE